MWERFECGCIGFRLDDRVFDHHGRRAGAVCVKPCEGSRCDYCEGGEISFGFRPDLANKASEPLEPGAVQNLIQELGRLTADGYRFRMVRSLIGS